MKFTKYALMAAGCALLASCSSEEPIVENGANNGTNTPAGNATGYASFTINLPTAKAGFGRAHELDEGTAQEYAVANGKALIFQNADTEDNAVFVCMDELTSMTWTGNSAADINTTSTSTAQLWNIDLAGTTQYSVVIVLNYDNDNFVFPSAGEKFGDWIKNKPQTSMSFESNGLKYLTMTNAAELKAGGTAPVTLVPLDKTKIGSDRAQANKNGSAADIYVQRGVAKVSVSTPESIDLPEESTYKGDKVKITAWALDITNKKSYAVQQTAGISSAYSKAWDASDAKNRFISHSTIFNRALWAVDPNYSLDIQSVAQTKSHFNVIATLGKDQNPDADYCLENTFDLGHMLQGQTTRVVFRGTYTPALPGYTAGDSFFKIGNGTQLYTQEGLQSEILAKAVIVLNKNQDNIVVDLSRILGNAGNYAINDISIKVKKNADIEEDITAEQKAAIAQALGLEDASKKEISNYKEGTVYYIARIKHFGDDETPWTIGQPTYGDINEANNKSWLGRYGMVRNTAYVMNVTKVSSPGSPVIPEIKPTTPDDEDTYFIRVSINVLSWAKRTNNVEL